jgi:hypothetical protein
LRYGVLEVLDTALVPVIDAIIIKALAADNITLK